MTIKSNVVPLPRVSRANHQLRQAAFVCHCDMAAQHMRDGDPILAGLQLHTALKLLDDAWPEKAEDRRAGTRGEPAATPETSSSSRSGVCGRPNLDGGAA